MCIRDRLVRPQFRIDTAVEGLPPPPGANSRVDRSDVAVDPGIRSRTLRITLQLGIRRLPAPSQATPLSCENARFAPVDTRQFRPVSALAMRRSGVRFSSQAPC